MNTFFDGRTGIIVLLVGLIAAGCSQSPEQPEALVKGRITITRDEEPSGNFSGTEVLIISKDSVGSAADTLYEAETDSTGRFSGTARFKRKSTYPMLLTRNNKRVAMHPVILADNDTLTVSAQLPQFKKTVELHSREHDAMNVLNRVQRSFNRVAMYARAGKISADSLPVELNKWSNLFWSVYEDHPHTIAGHRGALESIRLLDNINDSLMISRVQTLTGHENTRASAVSVGKEVMARERGLQPTLEWLDSLRQLKDKPETDMQLGMEYIKLLYDSARVGEARSQLTRFRKKYGERPEARKWIQNISYDLEFLAPGDTLPAFSFKTLDGRYIDNNTVKGHPFILEITTLAHPLYQQQFDRTVAIYHIYKNFGLQMLTIPLDTSQVTIEAFFQERPHLWPVAEAQPGERGDLIDRFNIHQIPTRFLVDQKGRIVRKYVGREFEDVIQGLKEVINQKKVNS